MLLTLHPQTHEYRSGQPGFLKEISCLSDIDLSLMMAFRLTSIGCTSKDHHDDDMFHIIPFSHCL